MERFKKLCTSRTFIFFLVIVLLFTWGISRLVYFQLVHGEEYAEKAQNQQLSDKEIEARRGTIYDSQGNVLAQSATVYNVFIDPSHIDAENRSVIVDFLSQTLGLDSEEKQELYENSERTDTKYVVVARKVEYKIRQKIAEFMSDSTNKKYGLKNCIGFEETTRRYYPYGSLASSVLGFTGSDNQGLEGLEAYYDEQLKGVNGRIITVESAVSSSIMEDYETTIPAQDGNSLVLSINSSIQYTLEQELRDALEEYDAKGTYGVVMDCNTGAILAMASLPDYDCNNPRTVVYDGYLEDIRNEEDEDKKAELESYYVQRQWRNFTVVDTYVPGSVYKVFMAAGAIEEGVADLNTTYTCNGAIQVEDYTMHCHLRTGHGFETFTQGLENSCNPFFITIGQRMGVRNYYKYFEGFGFTQRTGIDLPGETAPQYYKENQYSIVELSSASFGQTNNMSPIQICTALSAVANGGTLLKPYVVSEVKDADGKTISKTEPTASRQVISKETSETVLKMMKSVVDNGTGKNGYVAGYSVGGKTGTSTKLGESAEGEKDKYIISFAAVAPVDDPQIAMIILCDEPNQDLGGGAICAPIAAAVTEEAMKQLGIEPIYTDDEAEHLSVSVPSVSGKDIESANASLRNAGFSVEIVGNGSTVIKQNPSSGEAPRGGVVVLYTETNEEDTVTVPDFSGLTVSEVNKRAAEYNLNIIISGNDSRSSKVVAYKQSEAAGNEVGIGTVIKVTFKSTESVLD